MNTSIPTVGKKISFDRFGLYFCGLIPLVLLGFWKSYFSKFFGDAASITSYMHFHALVMTIWVIMLIVQPMLIRRKKLNIHRLIGKASYVVMPLVIVSMFLLIHKGGNLRPVEQRTFIVSLFAIMGVFIVGACYVVAIINRHNSGVHARAMIGSGIALLDPTLMRILGPYSFPGDFPAGYFLAIAIILGVFITLIVCERKQTKATWIFPSLLAIYSVMYFLSTFQAYTNNSIDMSPLDSMMTWFYALPLT